MKKYTVRVNKELAVEIEELYGKERQVCVNLSVPVSSLNEFLTKCLSDGLGKQADRLKKGRPVRPPEWANKTPLEIMDELLGDDEK